jgi:hypothetical protein
MLALFLGRVCRLASLYKTEVGMREIESILNYMSYAGNDMDHFDQETLAIEYFQFVKEQK